MSRWSLTRAEWTRLSSFGGAVLLLHVLGWGLFLYYSSANPALADSARSRTHSDCGTRSTPTTSPPSTTRRGSSSATESVRSASASSSRWATPRSCFHSQPVSPSPSRRPTRRSSASRSTAARSARVSRARSSGSSACSTCSSSWTSYASSSTPDAAHYDEERLEQRLLDRGFMNRFFFGQLARRITKSWQMFPLGVVFGLGFDTASEVALLALAAGVAAPHVPVLAVVSLPMLFAAGMSLMDTADGAFMAHAYGWAFSNRARKLYYNITVTSLSVVVALVVGTVQLLQVLSAELSLDSGFWAWLNDVDFSTLGYGIVALFVVTWTLSYGIWRVRRIEERWTSLVRSR